ncbi:PAS-domain containing protein [Rhodobacteraceae bacterium HSP-20]|uniref:histidine kinase n=1 Tax=Paragemmobacter amnigenus TaxID=2852097 RepID=A0ABS6J424_9RHOB|nr:PAS-domain containing protein [Rhodobacter amnigenus]MBU9698494.1 PAS-domain containing protein [Rhodobacter amnigenus]MBV4389721.1 PAS-domain containing protein [Rhodobacter amnigenus]
MIDSLIDPADPPERQTQKLLTIAQVLMRRVEQITDDSGAAYAQFQRAAMLEDQVRERTRDLERALDLLNDSNARLAEANRATEAARQNLANAIETIQEGFALFDAQDVLVMCNSRFGMHMSDVRPHLKPGLTFDDYVGRVSRSRFFELPPGETAQDWAVARRRRHQDRHVIFNVRMVWDRWVQVSEHRTADGGTVILQTDVTEIIRAERSERGKMLDDQARVIRATLDHIGQGVCIFDAEARLVGWNQRLGQLLTIPMARFRRGVSFDAILDRFRPDLAFGDGMTEGRLGDWVAGKGAGGRGALRFELRRDPDMIMDVFAQGMPDGGFVMSFTDVTAERAAIEALSRANETLEARVMARTLELEDALGNAERANASRSRFVAAASHDLLQPLSAAKLFISSVPDEGLAPDARAALDKAQNALLSVEGILGALLDISKLESGRAAVSVGPVRLDRLLSQLNDEFGAIAAAKGLRLTVLPARITVTSDPAYLRRILQNLIGNAIRYTDRGRVLVGVRRKGATARIEVRDTGPGIPEEEQDNIFKEFHRLNARASASEGMGLGLAIVERACALLGHPLGLVSEIGRGTCFMVQVPRSESAAASDGPRPSPPPRPSIQNRIVFLVENDADLRRAMGLLLEKWGVNVLDAASGEEALSLIDELGILPDGFIVDYNLGEGMDGLRFLSEMQARHGPVPARIVTADRRAELHAACAAAGIGVMMKPLEPRALEAFVAGLPAAG